MNSSRQGNATLAVLLAGIFFVLLVFTVAAMSNQAKASETLKGQVKELQNTQLAAGLPVSPAPKVKGAKIDKRKLKKYEQAGIRFSYPDNLVLKQIDSQTAELATDRQYFGASVVPKNHALVKIRTNVQMSLDSLDEYLKQAPYAAKHELTVTNGLAVLIITNKLNTTVWYQAVIAASPQGPYHFVTALPGDSMVARDIFDTITQTFQLVIDGAN